MLKNARLVFWGIPYTRENGPIPVAFYNLFWFDTWACMTCISIAPLSKMAPISGFAQRSNLDEGQETVPRDMWSSELKPPATVHYWKLIASSIIN